MEWSAASQAAELEERKKQKVLLRLWQKVLLRLSCPACCERALRQWVVRRGLQAEGECHEGARRQRRAATAQRHRGRARKHYRERRVRPFHRGKGVCVVGGE